MNSVMYDNQKPSGNTASLYVGDLDLSINEDKLFSLFNAIGPVASIRVCIDKDSGRSLGYGYVNFHHMTDAEKARTSLNFTKLGSREIRIMPTEPDATLRKNGVGNVFIKNLESSIDNKTLFDTFSVFGKILSSKVVCDENGNSLKYGFVHFQNSSSAENAIDKVNKMEIAGKVVEVSHFRPSNQRHKGKRPFTNIYVKDFDGSFFENEVAFKEFFEKFGDVTSVHFPFKEDQTTPKGFGFVNFKEPEVARQVVEKIHKVSPQNLYIVEAMTKSQRRNMLQSNFVKWRAEMDRKTAGRNVYMKNLPENVNENELKEEMAKFGTVESFKLVRDEKDVPKGFAYVLYKTKENAADAIKTMHGHVWKDKTLFVTLFQRNHVRQKTKQNNMRQNQSPFNGLNNFSPVSQMIYPQLMYQPTLGQMPPQLGAQQRYMPSIPRNMMAPINIGTRMMNGQMAGMTPQAQYAQRTPQQVFNSPRQQQMQQQMQQQQMQQQQMQQQQQLQQLQQQQQMQQMQQQMQQQAQNEEDIEMMDPTCFGPYKVNLNSDSLADTIFHLVKAHNAIKPEKVTGIFMDMPRDDLRALLSKTYLFEKNIAKASKMIEANNS